MNVQLQPHDFDGPCGVRRRILLRARLNQPVHGNLLHSGAMSDAVVMLATRADAFS